MEVAFTQFVRNDWAHSAEMNAVVDTARRVVAFANDAAVRADVVAASAFRGSSQRVQDLFVPELQRLGSR